MYNLNFRPFRNIRQASQGLIWQGRGRRPESSDDKGSQGSDKTDKAEDDTESSDDEGSRGSDKTDKAEDDTESSDEKY